MTTSTRTAATGRSTAARTTTRSWATSVTTPGEGGPGDDTIGGGTGFDTLVGGAGDDALEPEKGHDVVDGGPGSDTAVYSDEPAAVIVDLAKNSTIKASGRDNLPSIENLIGSRFDDALYGDSAPNVLRRRPGQGQALRPRRRGRARCSK